MSKIAEEGGLRGAEASVAATIQANCILPARMIRHSISQAFRRTRVRPRRMKDCFESKSLNPGDHIENSKGLHKNNFTFCCRLHGLANPQKDRHRKLDNVKPAALRGAAAGGHLRRCRIG